MRAQLEAVRDRIEAGDPEAALAELHPGGARNALDCALLDLAAKTSGIPVWKALGLSPPVPPITCFTCGADSPDRMAAAARNYTQARSIKLKLTGESSDEERVLAVREACPEAILTLDANQSFTPSHLQRLNDCALRASVRFLEQPFAAGADHLLDGLDLAIPICADESAQTTEDLNWIAERYDYVNVKLDKAGGLREAVRMARAATEAGLKVTVGNMVGTSLAMAPAALLGSFCELVDLDGPLFLLEDRNPPAIYRDGRIDCPEAIWGYPLDGCVANGRG
jgi:L-alanine-DL-glutamate epimerase-like enolase superfamily enzyme